MGQRRDLDPKLYQYGGLWIYPVAGLLGAAHVAGFVELTGDLAFYLDRPGEFGKFYIVARLYSALWGAIGAALVLVMVRRVSQSRFAGFSAAATFMMLPVVVTAAHEAKPHLAGAVLLLWATLKADDFVRTGRHRDAAWAGVLVGAASAMVVSMVVGFAILPVMGLLRWRHGSTGSGCHGSTPNGCHGSTRSEAQGNPCGPMADTSSPAGGPVTPRNSREFSSSDERRGLPLRGGTVAPGVGIVFRRVGDGGLTSLGRCGVLSECRKSRRFTGNVSADGSIGAMFGFSPSLAISASRCFRTTGSRICLSTSRSRVRRRMSG